MTREKIPMVLFWLAGGLSAFFTLLFVLERQFTLSLAIPELKSLVLFSTLLILMIGYFIGGKLDRASNIEQLRIVRVHFAVHAVPFSYFFAVFFLAPVENLTGLYVVPFMLFFYTGTKAWKIIHQETGVKVFHLFRLGNKQMIFLFPLAFLVQSFSWLGPDKTPYIDLVNGYFAVHFILAGIAIPLMDSRQGNSHSKLTTAKEK